MHSSSMSIMCSGGMLYVCMYEQVNYVLTPFMSVVENASEKYICADICFE